MTGTVMVIQARMGSSRLPGKVLKPIAGRPMLAYQIERLRPAQRVDHIMVATTTNSPDDAIVAFCESEGIDCTLGSEPDVLSRYHAAAESSGATTVVRVTSDCPLLEAQLVDRALDEFFQRPQCDYLSNMLTPTFPYGMAIEVISRDALDEAHREAVDPEEREHVTPFIYRRPERFRMRSLTMQPDLSHHRWTVDTPEDFELVSLILARLHPINPHFELNDVLTLLHDHPSWSEINRHISQKSVSHTRKEDR